MRAELLLKNTRALDWAKSLLDACRQKTWAVEAAEFPKTVRVGFTLKSRSSRTFTLQNGCWQLINQVDCHGDYFIPIPWWHMSIRHECKGHLDYVVFLASRCRSTEDFVNGIFSGELQLA